LLGDILLVLRGIVASQHFVDRLERTEELGSKRTLLLLPVGIGARGGVETTTSGADEAEEK
jgi:hypothetical protein